jgi:hypothetical protein
MTGIEPRTAAVPNDGIFALRWAVLRGFYENQGLTATGEEFEPAPAGPHYVFVVKLAVPPAP